MNIHSVDFGTKNVTWKCEKCGKLCRVNGEWVGKLECSHYIGRVKRSVRFDVENARSLCSSCHQRMGGYKPSEDGEYDVWMKSLLGSTGYRNLILRANLPRQQKIDKKMEALYVRELRKQLIADGKLKVKGIV